jgi:hypothetical protein
MFLLSALTCFGQTGHQVYKVCLRSLLCFPFDVLHASRCFIQIMLHQTFVSNHVCGVCFLNMLLSFSLVLYLLCLVLCVFHIFGSQKEETLKPRGFWLGCTRMDNNQNSIQIYTQCNRMLKYNIMNSSHMHIKGNSPFLLSCSLLAYFLYFEKIKVGLRVHHAVCVSVNSSPVNFWMPEPLFMKLCVCVSIYIHIYISWHLSPSR